MNKGRTEEMDRLLKVRFNRKKNSFGSPLTFTVSRQWNTNNEPLVSSR